MFNNLCSIEKHTFEALGKKLLYIVPTFELYVVDDVVYDLLQLLDRPDSAVQTELSRRYAPDEITLAFEEAQYLDARINHEHPAPSIQPYIAPLNATGIRLNVAHDCNLCCTYCYAQQGDYGLGRSMMSREIAEAAVDFLFARNDGSTWLAIEFFGGEPLLNFGVIEHTVKYAKQVAESRKQPVGFSITTNGTIATEEMLSFLAEHKFAVSITIDGDSDSHNRTRPFCSGRGSHAVVLANVRRMLERGIIVMFNSILTEASPSLTERYKYLREIGLPLLRISSVAAHRKDGQLRVPDITVLNQSLDQFAEYYLQQALEGNYEIDRSLSKEHRMFKKAIRAILAKPETVKHGCVAACNIFGISPEGDIYPCYMFMGCEDCVLGNVTTGLDEQARMRFLEKAQTRMLEKCRTCWTRYICTGGCFRETHEYDLFMPDVPCQDWSICHEVKRSAELALAIYSELAEQPHILAALGWTQDQPDQDSLDWSFLQQQMRQALSWFEHRTKSISNARMVASQVHSVTKESETIGEE